MSTFTYRGRTLDLLDHSYNTTAENERAIEVPIAWAWIADQDLNDGLEVGNVLGHYGPAPWRRVDRYEQAEGVESLDVFDIDGTYPWIVAISTLEHVGNWPGEPDNPGLAVKALDHLRTLTDHLLVTVPFDHNDRLDDVILDGTVDATLSTTFLWSPDGWAEAPGAIWGPRRRPHIWPSHLWVAEWHR